MPSFIHSFSLLLRRLRWLLLLLCLLLLLLLLLCLLLLPMLLLLAPHFLESDHAHPRPLHLLTQSLQLLSQAGSGGERGLHSQQAPAQPAVETASQCGAGGTIKQCGAGGAVGQYGAGGTIKQCGAGHRKEVPPPPLRSHIIRMMIGLPPEPDDRPAP